MARIWCSWPAAGTGCGSWAGELAAGSGAAVEVVPADLARPGGAGLIVQTLAQRHIEVDVLVNNAGFGARGSWT